MRRGRTSLAANPVLVGAITTLIVVTAVFLAYNANSGLPFVPTYELKVIAPDGARLVVGNEVREGGFRIGQVRETDTVRRSDGRTVAELTLQLDDAAAPVPEDSTVLIRPRSTLGLKYVDFVRGSSRTKLPQGATIEAREASTPPELDDFFSIFDERTRENARTNLTTFGSGLAGRGPDLNRTLDDLPELLRGLVPVMRTLAAEDTRLRAFVGELADVTRVVRPVAGDLVAGLASGADVFEAISRDPAALRDTIGESPSTLQAGIESFRAQRPLLRSLANISDEVQDVSRELRAGAPAISRALGSGTETLPLTPPFNRRLGQSLDALRTLASAPTTNLVIDGLTSTVRTLNPTLQWVGPHITVCNYWNYWWTLISDHFAEHVQSGTLERIQVKQAGGGMAFFGATEPAHGTGPSNPIEGDHPRLHGQPYGRAVDEQGNADCETGQRGYQQRNTNVRGDYDIVTSARTPGNQGPTFTGKPRVPDGQTFSAEPTGTSTGVIK